MDMISRESVFDIESCYVVIKLMGGGVARVLKI